MASLRTGQFYFVLIFLEFANCDLVQSRNITTLTPLKFAFPLYAFTSLMTL